jgi:hypothetical protein
MPSQPESTDDSAAARLTPKDVDFEAVARISTQVELKAVRLTFLHADIVERDGPIPADWTDDVVSGLAAESSFEREKKELAVECGFLAVYAPGVNPTTEELPDPKDAPVELHARFRLVYELRDASAVRDGDPEHFALANGVLHAWPYWRELAQATTMRMGLTPLVVGTVKIPWRGDPEAKG